MRCRCCDAVLRSNVDINTSYCSECRDPRHYMWGYEDLNVQEEGTECLYLREPEEES